MGVGLLVVGVAHLVHKKVVARTAVVGKLEGLVGTRWVVVEHSLVEALRRATFLFCLQMVF